MNSLMIMSDKVDTFAFLCVEIVYGLLVNFLAVVFTVYI